MAERRPGRDPARSATTITWHDPADLAAQISRLPGRQYLQALLDGALPVEAFPSALGIMVASVTAGSVTLEATVADWQLNAGGSAHGGFLSALMDFASGLAVHNVLEAGQVGPHVQASYRFLRPAPRHTRLTCTAQVVHRGRTLAVARAEIHDGGGRLIALGDTTHAYAALGKRADEA